MSDYYALQYFMHRFLVVCDIMGKRPLFPIRGAKRVLCRPPRPEEQGFRL